MLAKKHGEELIPPSYIFFLQGEGERAKTEKFLGYTWMIKGKKNGNTYLLEIIKE